MRLSVFALAFLILAGEMATARAADPETPASPSHTPAWQAEAWYFYQNTTNTAQQQRLTARFYQPFFLGDGWQLTMREDIRMLYSDEKGADNPTGAWLVHTGDWFAQAALKTPHMAPGFSADLGLRVLFPTGNLPPFSTGRYQIGPHFGLIWDLPGTARLVTLAPLVRYMQSFGYQPEHSTPTSELQVHPIIAARPGTGLAITLWREHPWLLDTRTNKWFIPFDAMVSYEVMPRLSVGVGAAVSLLADYPQYNNIIYGRAALSF